MLISKRVFDGNISKRVINVLNKYIILINEIQSEIEIFEQQKKSYLMV